MEEVCAFNWTPNGEGLTAYRFMPPHPMCRCALPFVYSLPNR